MAHNLTGRIAALEQKSVKPPKVFRIICKGATPTPEEQAQIDNAREGGANLFIIRLIAAHLKTDH